ncbi:MAG: tetratricopeptide repeat protein [Armatimonadetes bacterium]|nr:tetratricopeptide repeat protein [Armatimonadota bacterium]
MSVFSVACPACRTLNSLDSTFCKHCGASLPEESLHEVRQRAAQLLTNGFVALNEDKLDEATQIAEACIDADPANHSAYALRAMCLERKGALEAALAEYEHVVELSPDSALDQLKVNQLKAQIANRAIKEEDEGKSRKRNNLVLSISAAVLVLSVAAIVLALAYPSGKPTNQVAVNDRSQPIPGVATPFPEVKSPTAPAPAPKSDDKKGGDTTGTTAPVDTPADPSAPDNSGKVKPTTTPSVLPNPNDATVPVKLNLDPTQLNPPVGNNNTQSAGPSFPPATASGRDNSVDPGPLNANSASSKPSSDNNSDLGQGIIELKVTHVKPPTVGGSQAVQPTGNGLEALMKAARNQFQTGNFEGAARSFSKALEAGAEPGKTNQRLAQCYERLGKNAEAISCYQRAAEAYERAINAGRGDANLEKQALSACRQAIKLLGG